MQAIFAARGVTDSQRQERLIDIAQLHMHDASQGEIVWNDVQAIQRHNEMFADDLPVPLTASEGYNQHGHSSPYDGGFIGLHVHNHVDNFSGGLAFACYHPGTTLPQQPWAI